MPEPSDADHSAKDRQEMNEKRWSVQTWLSMLHHRFGDQKFRLEDAMEFLGNFAPRGVLTVMRDAGTVELGDDGWLRIIRPPALSYQQMPRRIHPDSVQDTLEETRAMVKRSAEMLDRLRGVLRQVDHTGLERLRNQRQELQAERVGHETRVATHEAEESAKRSRRASLGAVDSAD